MARNQAKAPRASQALATLPPKRPHDTQTAWEDPWKATQAARETLANSQTPYGRGGALPDARAVGRRITEEINADPAEVERLRSARKNARAGKTFPRHSDTK
jgi:hypothetical protein